jgi:hypothetical protein
MKKRFSGAQIVSKLRQADVLIGQGKTVPELGKEIEISQQTYYRWRQKYAVHEIQITCQRDFTTLETINAGIWPPIPCLRMTGNTPWKWLCIGFYYELSECRRFILKFVFAVRVLRF